MDEQQELSRSFSLPVLNREDVVIKKVQEQDGIIALMQTQIELQTERISKHDKLFEDCLSKLEDLTSKVKCLEEIFNKQKEVADRDAKKSALWAPAGGASESVSIADMAKETAEQAVAAETGYVYDESSGLYFDQSSGYYYDPVKQLFYNGHTKTYYSYDASTNTYHVQPTDSIKRKKIEKVKPKKATKQQKMSKSPRSSSVTDTPASPGQDNKEPNWKTNGCEENDEVIDETITSTTDAQEVKPAIASPQQCVSKSLSDMEEGEISSSAPPSPASSDSAANTLQESDNSYSIENSEDDSQQGGQLSYPPCIRAVVQSSNRSLTKGTLFLVPYTGGTIGSKGNQHVILLPTPSVEKVHAKIYFQSGTASDEDGNESSKDVVAASGSGKYYIIDLGSKEGTFLNKIRISESGITSEPFEIVHGSTLQIGDTLLLIHIHPGDFTCGHCEPGLLIEKGPMYEYTAGESNEKVRKAEMKKMKKKYGLDRKHEGTEVSKSKAAYNDRAESRRKKIGSDNPFAKTVVASTETPITESNVGFKMLKKMGWKGDGLGNPQNSGIKEPINCEVKNNRGGLGLQNSSLLPSASAVTALNESGQKKSRQLKKTIERFKECDGDGAAAEGSSKVNEDFEY